MKIVKVMLTLIATLIFLATPACAAHSVSGEVALKVDSPIQSAPKTSASNCGVAQGQVKLTVKFPNQPTLNLPAPWTQNATVSLAMHNLEYLQKLKFGTTFSCPYGNLVNKINGVTAPNNSYWGLFINNQFSNFGIDSAVLQNGDSILWKLCPVSGNCLP